MPVRKFRSIDETSCDLWYEPGDPRLWDAIAAVWSFAARASELRFPPGVYKHRSIEESESLRELWETAGIRRRAKIDAESASVGGGTEPRDTPFEKS
jgi:hypothetical protein